MEKNLYNIIRDPSEVMKYILPLLAIVLVFLFVDFLFYLHRKKKNHILSRLTPKKAHGIIFGKDGKKLVVSECSHQEHTLIIGPSGSGKSRLILIPSIKAIDSSPDKHTFFALDVCSDLTHGTPDLKNRVIYDPLFRESKTVYNVFHRIDECLSEDEKKMAIDQLVLQLLPDSENGSSDASVYYLENGRKFLRALFSYAIFFANLDFIDSCKFFQECDTPKNFIQELRMTKHECYKHVSSLSGENDNNLFGSYNKAKKALDFFIDTPAIHASLKRPGAEDVEFNPSLLDKKSVFVLIPEQLQDDFAPLARIIISDVITYCYERPIDHNNPQKLFLILDELSSWGHISELEGAMERLRKHRVRFICAFQTVKQLYKHYGVYETISENCMLKAFLGVTGETAKWAEELCGQAEHKKISRTTSANHNSTTTSTAKESAIDAADISRLNKKLLLVHPYGYEIIQKNE